MAFPDEIADAGFGAVQVSFSYSGRVILDEIDFHVVPGEIHALVGKQNEGKSTFSNILAGELVPSGGWILAHGIPYRGLDPALARRLGVERVDGAAKVFPSLSVAENLYTGYRKWWDDLCLWKDGFSRIRDWLASHSIRLPYRKPLSSMRREDWLFVELLNRLCREPRLLILDETLEHLPKARLNEVMPVIRDRLADGMGVLWVTHKLEDALASADRVTVLRQGRTVFTDFAMNTDRLTLLRLCYSEMGERDGEELTREQFYEMMSFVEAMFRDLPSAVIISDLEERIRFINRSGRTLFPDCANPNGATLRDFFGEKNRRLGELTSSATYGVGEQAWHSLPVTFGDGGERLVDVRAKSIQERSVRIGCMTVIEDVTAREEMRRKLALSESLASIGLLAAGVAHEVNDPLAIIGNYLGFVRRQAISDEVAKAVDLARDETVRIQQIVANLVAFSGKRAAAGKRVDLLALIKELCTLLRFHAKGRSIRFACVGPETPVIVDADSNEMRQVFLNLYRNSLDAIEHGGEIRAEVSVECRGNGEDLARVRIADTGSGIRLSNPNDIFKPFVTTKKGRNSHQGLGLSIVYGIVGNYGGSIQVRNLEEGGCEFTLLFPLAAALQEKAHADAKAFPIPPDTHSGAPVDSKGNEHRQPE